MDDKQLVMAEKAKAGSLDVPYHCYLIDASWADVVFAFKESTYPSLGREKILQMIHKQWTRPENPNYVLPCLCVRSGFDLYLRVMKYPPGSEIIMSAISIPDMAVIIKHHGLRPVPIDVCAETLGPKVDVLESLITEKTVAVLVAHIYGKWFKMEDIIRISHLHKLHVLEDCAEGFHGLQNVGHPESDLAFFSFGVIKVSSAFGGGIVKIRDAKLYNSMREFHALYPMQSDSEYLKKVAKYALVLTVSNDMSEQMTKYTKQTLQALDIDYKQVFQQMLKGFPNEMINKIRHQPSTVLLYMVHRRVANFDIRTCEMTNKKSTYVKDRLPSCVGLIGTKAEIQNHWLFPILVHNPKEVCTELNKLGVDAFQGSTSLSVIEPSNGNNIINYLSDLITHYPKEAKFILDHVLYLPVHRQVPYHHLDRIILAMELVMNKLAYEKFCIPQFDSEQMFVKDSPSKKVPHKMSKL
ncbi:uncharacterized protein LOC100367139 [Saccoglossus kowalevskii]|uniref:Uncharacterized protein LOC100367139 n=1 Tax=Saccoglossus kowalevskii TaxID=10224 RepID=A0ABM0GWZ0_SACKO|nr:PREDICTED: uncharacterized protein LOC100367139 [Saccoglossus kowalevskii]